MKFHPFIDFIQNFKVKFIPNAKSLEILDLIRRIDIFASLTLSDAYELLQMCKHKHYEDGDTVVRHGTPGDAFYVIVRGEASVMVPHDKVKSPKHRAESRHAVVKRYISGDFFGEQALVTSGGVRTADIIAQSSLHLLEFNACDFTWILEHTDVPSRIRQLTESRNNYVWDTLMRNSVFKTLSTSQKTQLELALRKVEYRAGDRVWSQGDPCEYAVFVEDGNFCFDKKSDTPSRRRSLNLIVPTISSTSDKGYSLGAFLGEVDRLMSPDSVKAETNLKAVSSGSLLRIDRSDLRRFLSENPGILLAVRGRQCIL